MFHVLKIVLSLVMYVSMERKIQTIMSEKKNESFCILSYHKIINMYGTHPKCVCCKLGKKDGSLFVKLIIHYSG